MLEYAPRYKSNNVICGSGPVVIVCGWSIKQMIAKKIPVEHYAAIGNLYSPTRGLTPLIRNLILNPHIRLLALFGVTKEDKNAGSIECLMDFFDYGVRPGKNQSGQECWVVNSPIEGFVDNVIELPVIEKLRHSVVVEVETHSIAGLVEKVGNMVHAYEGIELAPWGEPIDFPEREVVMEVWPGPRYGHRIEGETIAETWLKILHRIKATGRICPAEDGGKRQELIDVVAVVTQEPEDFYLPDPNYLSIDKDFLEGYIPHILEDSPYEDGTAYTYGQRLRSWFGCDQVEQAIAKLGGQEATLRAVMSLWDVNDYEHEHPPCLNHIWVRAVDEELSLTATFRSNDMFGAWPSNAIGLRALQKHIRDELLSRFGKSFSLGALIIFSESAHIYEDSWEYVDSLLEKHYPSIIKKFSYSDPAGSFIVSIDANSKQILVEWITPHSGETVKSYQSKNSRSLYRAIAADCPYLETEHALYLGTELHKAEMAIALNMEYNQDARLIHGIW